MTTQDNVLLIGAGGHAKGVVEAMALCGRKIHAYADPKEAQWLDCQWEQDASQWIATHSTWQFIMGIGGVRVEQLTSRLHIFNEMRQQGGEPVTVIHPRSCVSPDAVIGAGAIIMAGTAIQPGAHIGQGAIVNTGAIVEHDSIIGSGAHVAPGAIVLGQCEIGECSMIGSGCVILQGNRVESRTLVAAQTRYPKPVITGKT